MNLTNEMLSLPLNIQLFGEDDSAANEDTIITLEELNDNTDVDADNTDELETNVTENSAQEVTNTKKSKTKEYSERLNADREKIRKELEAENSKKLDAIAQSRGFENWEELEKITQEEEMKELGVTDVSAFSKYLDRMISNNPKILQANKILEEQKERDRQKEILDDVEKIHELDDSISSLEDLMEHPNYEAMLEKVKNGSNLVDAYKLVNFDLLMGKSSKEGAERTYKNVTNKSHIRTTSGGATNDVHVPSDVMAMYKKNMPSWTEEQIKKHYASAVKGE